MGRHAIIFKTLRTLVVGVVLFIVCGNLAILGANVLARATLSLPRVPHLRGVANLEAVDDHLWRGAAPTERGYRLLARHGVRTIVDLRAEEGIVIDEALLRKLDINLVRLPLRDGQAPSAAKVRRFLRVVERSERRVFVHCGAGVGRTGTMAAAYLVETGQADGLEALGRNLAVGPPSLEQITFAAQLAGGRVKQPPAPVTWMSRVLDGPRRMWVNVTKAYGE